MDYFKLKPSELPKTTILVDNGYHPDKIEKELVKVYPEIMTKIQFELSPKPSKTEKAEKGCSGFVPVKTRWGIERSNSWMERCKSLVKNFERTLEHSTTKIHLCFLRLLLRRLAVS
ncbi:transposase [Microcystis aeruginosa FD4]|uniref:Transposase n=1 Tax=Microcystis aeruginosa FD4 TaxID=2686288 RepID=A0A857DB70_MICAE|nr:transposase [Microcystis aeruginosa FD4]